MVLEAAVIVVKTVVATVNSTALTEIQWDPATELETLTQPAPEQPVCHSTTTLDVKSGLL
jgi:hypothetical protein